MTEARKPEYLVDGFMIRHFQIFPMGFDKENLFEDQKIFLMYLVGNVPSMENWHTSIDYKNKRQSILSSTSITLTDEEITLAQLHGTDIAELKRSRLVTEKKRLLSELDDRFGIERKEEEHDILEESGMLSTPAKSSTQDQRHLWEMLEGKGVISNA